MNTIRVYNDHIDKKEIDHSIELTYMPHNEISHANCMRLIIKESTELEIIYHNDQYSTWDIHIDALENTFFSLYEYREGSSIKADYHYRLAGESEMNLYKFSHTNSVKEQNTIELNGRGAKVVYRVKTISTKEEKYDTTVYHNAPNTICDIYNHAVNCHDGEVSFHITNAIEKGIKGCVINQNSRIITMNHKKCVIKPVLLIEENEVEASHAAHIGTFEKEDLFYLQSRGITKEKAENLLIQGFLLASMGNVFKDPIQKIINTYWR